MADLTELKGKIRRYTEIRNELLRRNARKEKHIKSAEKNLKNVPSEGNIWKDSYLHQYQQNEQLEAEQLQLQAKLNELKRNSEGATKKSSGSGMNIRPQQQIAKLEKELDELEWDMSDCGWRLDQTSQAVHRLQKEKEDLLTQLAHTQ